MSLHPFVHMHCHNMIVLYKVWCITWCVGYFWYVASGCCWNIRLKLMTADMKLCIRSINLITKWTQFWILNYLLYFIRSPSLNCWEVLESWVVRWFYFQQSTIGRLLLVPCEVVARQLKSALLIPVVILVSCVIFWIWLKRILVWVLGEIIIMYYFIQL